MVGKGYNSTKSNDYGTLSSTQINRLAPMSRVRLRVRPAGVRPVWHALQQRVDELLASISLADLMKQELQVQELVGISSAS